MPAIFGGLVAVAVVGVLSSAKSVVVVVVVVFWRKYSCTFGPDGIEIKQRSKKLVQIPKVAHRVILW